MRRLVLIFSIALCALVARDAFATSQASTNFQNQNSSIVPASFASKSSSYQINGSVEAVVGAAESPSFSVRSGVPLQGAVPEVVSPDTGTGGLGQSSSIGYVVPPTLSYRSLTFLSHQMVQGTRGSADTIISVNGSSDGVSYPTDRTWQRDIPLFLGRNTIAVFGTISSGYKTPRIGGEIERMLIGDVSRDHIVNDIDLSLFTRAWKTYTPFADFNEDGKIDDRDLSLLVSHWGAHY